MRVKVASIALILFGVLAIAAALLTRLIGFDPTAYGWGASRRVVLLAGLVIMLIGAAWFLLIVQRPRASAWFRSIVHAKGTVALVSLSCLLVIAVYVWLVSVGRWTTWPEITHDYDRLASAFQHGHLALEEQPNAALTRLQNPYECPQRGNIPYLWDASLYRGRYFLYFGVVPALVLLPARVIMGQVIGDQYLVFGLLLALFAASALLLALLWRRFFSHLPPWTLAIAVLLAGLISPAPWLLSRPAIYEAAVASSQFFFIVGICVAYMALEAQAVSPWPWLLVGTAWILAIGSRPTTAIPVVFMLALVLWGLYKGAAAAERPSAVRIKMAAVLLPLVVGAAALGWYNAARFGSPLEFGLNYQLTRMDMSKFKALVFSARYIPQNLQAYLLQPFSLIDRFPFLKPQVQNNPACASLNLSSIYETDGTTGLLYCAPYVLLALIPGAALAKRPFTAFIKDRLVQSNKADWLLSWIVLGLAGSALLSFALLLVFFYSSMRYLEDTMPALILLASIGLWQGYDLANRASHSRIWYSLMALTLAAASSLAGILLAVTGPEDRFRQLNHALLHNIISFFSR